MVKVVFSSYFMNSEGCLFKVMATVTVCVYIVDSININAAQVFPSSDSYVHR